MNLAKFGLGGKTGSGNQFITWIHEEDFVQIILKSIENNDIEGLIHCASPKPVTNKKFMR